MTFLRLLGIGAVYGLAFALIKSLFPTPVILLMFSGATAGEGNLTVLALTYIGVGLLAGLVAAPVFGGVLLSRRGSGTGHAPSSGTRLVLSLGLALLMGVISGLLTLGAYAVGILQTGGVLDPLSLIRSSNFPTGVPLLVAWSIARDLLPAGLAGLFLAPVSGGPLLRLYAEEDRPSRKPTTKTSS